MSLNIRSVKAIARPLALIAAFSATAFPAPGDLDLDLTFGTNGLVVASFLDRDQAFDMVVQPDGKFVVIGTTTAFAYDDEDFLIARFHPNGSLDTSFGYLGKTSFDIQGGPDIATSVALQPDGKIVVAGSTRPSFSGEYTDRFAIVRFNANGSLDTSFGSGGKVIRSFFGFYNRANAVVVQADGRILVAGTATQTSNFDSAGFALARYNPNGSVDFTFNYGGVVFTEITNFQDIADALAIQPDGKIIVGGTTQPGGAWSQFDFALARYNPDGSLDVSFGTGGKVITDVTDSDHIQGLVIEPHGKIIVGGTANSTLGNSERFAMARYHANGTLDTSFGAGGKVSTVFSRRSTATAIARQTNGKIVIAGSIAGPNNDFADLAMARYNVDGSLDATFGVAGQKVADLSANGSDAAAAIAIRPDGHIVVAGIFSNRGDNSYDFMLARFMGDVQNVEE